MKSRNFAIWRNITLSTDESWDEMPTKLQWDWGFKFGELVSRITVKPSLHLADLTRYLSRHYFDRTEISTISLCSTAVDIFCRFVQVTMYS